MNHNILKILLMTFLPFFYSACKKDEVPQTDSECLYCEDQTKDTFQLEVIWSRPIGNTTYYTNLIPVVYNNLVLMGAEEQDREVIYCMDKFSGDQFWKWNDYLGNGWRFTQKIDLINGLGVISNSYRDYVIDMQTGATVWRYETPIGIASSPRNSVIGNQVYHPWGVEGTAKDSVARMMRSGLQQPQWEEVYVQREDSVGYGVYFEPPSLWMDSQGDSNLVFQNRYYNFVKRIDRNDFMVYNLRKKEMRFTIDNIGKTLSNGQKEITAVHPILISGSKAILFGWLTVYCIDLVNGNVLWQYTPPNAESNNMGNVRSIINGSSLFIKTSYEALVCLDINTGKPKWIRNMKDEGLGGGNMVIYEQKLYFLSNRLLCLNANTGETVFKYKSPNANRTPKGTFGGKHLYIDQNTGYMYFTDSYYFNCVKLK